MSDITRMGYATRLTGSTFLPVVPSLPLIVLKKLQCFVSPFLRFLHFNVFTFTISISISNCMRYINMYLFNAYKAFTHILFYFSFTKNVNYVVTKRMYHDNYVTTKCMGVS